MSLVEVTDALKPFLVTFGVNFTDDQWEQYWLALRDVNPGDLDDALADVRKSHAFRNAPLPAEILDRVNAHRQRRIVNRVPEPAPVVDAGEGEWKELTLKGIGTMRVWVLPDNHPAVQRFACFSCKDTGWVEVPSPPTSQPTFQRCGCVARNPVMQTRRTRRAEKLAKVNS